MTNSAAKESLLRFFKCIYLALSSLSILKLVNLLKLPVVFRINLIVKFTSQGLYRTTHLEVGAFCQIIVIFFNTARLILTKRQASEQKYYPRLYIFCWSQL